MHKSRNFPLHKFSRLTGSSQVLSVARSQHPTEQHRMGLKKQLFIELCTCLLAITHCSNFCTTAAGWYLHMGSCWSMYLRWDVTILSAVLSGQQVKHNPMVNQEDAFHAISPIINLGAVLVAFSLHSLLWTPHLTKTLWVVWYLECPSIISFPILPSCCSRSQREAGIKPKFHHPHHCNNLLLERHL